MQNILAENPLITELREKTNSLYQERGLTQKEMARLTGLSQSQLSAFLSKKRGLDMNSFTKLSFFVDSQSLLLKESEEST